MQIINTIRNRETVYRKNINYPMHYGELHTQCILSVSQLRHGVSNIIP